MMDGSTMMARRRRRLATAGIAIGLAAALLGHPATGADPTTKPMTAGRLFARENLVAWCIVPFDSKKRGPEDRAAMLERLGFGQLAYDWRAEHVPTFDAEMEALARHKIKLAAFWAPGELNADTRAILDVLKRHGIKAELWVLLDLGADRATGAEQARRVDAAAAKLGPLAAAAAGAGCSIALYNHGGWFGEPENQVAIVENLASRGHRNIGVVYNLHHGHDHVDRFPAVLAMLLPHLRAVNLNGMDPGGDKVGRKILPIGQGSLDLPLLKAIVDSGYRGPIGILGHTDDDAEERLRDNLDGLDWLVPQLEGGAPGPPPKPRTPVPPRPVGIATPEDAATVAALIREARSLGDPARGAAVFASTRSACLSCHKVGEQGGAVGPDLTTVGACVKPEDVVESLLWPRRRVAEGYEAITIALADGRTRQGFKVDESPAEVAIREPSSGEVVRIARAEIDETRNDGSLMPEGLFESLSAAERRDLVRFLLDLGRPGAVGAGTMSVLSGLPAPFPFAPKPLDPDRNPGWQLQVNRNRPYDYYAKEAAYFLAHPAPPHVPMPPYPGVEGNKNGHWGTQNESSWADGRWNRTDLGTVLSGVFRAPGVVVPKGVCVRLGDEGELAACFNPETLCYEALWSGGFVSFSATRHGFMDGLQQVGTPLPRPEGSKPAEPFVYRGFYRHGRRIVFAYRLGDVEMLDAPWVEAGQFRRVVGPAESHPMAHVTRGGGPARWPQVIETKGAIGREGPYAIDTIEPPLVNPWNALMFFGDHDFLPDGSAMIATMQGDVWHVSGLDSTLDKVRWRRFAAGLHQALGLVVSGGEVYALGRDQITRLRDLDGDGEADFHECFSNAYRTSPGGHDFICGLQRDAQGRFYTASGPQGILRIAADGKSVEVLATGFRNPDGLGLAPDGTLLAPNSEGEWTPASMVAEVRRGGHYGYNGPRDGQAPDLPLVYLPRGLDNSSGGQAFVTSDRFGPLAGRAIHLSFGAGTWNVLLRDAVDGQPQGAVVPMPGAFRSGSHRGRFNPADGQLYVSGQAGWGTYTSEDGSFQRVRYTGEPAQLPTSIHAHENGVLLGFAQPLEPDDAERPDAHLAQAWNYRYGPGYGSQEYAPGHPGVAGHDRWPIRSAHVLGDDRRTLFLEIPAIQPVNQLHLHVDAGAARPVDIFATVHRLDAPFTGFNSYRPEPKTIAAHPILADMAALAIKPKPNPWAEPIAGARPLAIAAGPNLSFSTRTLRARAGEPIRLRFSNPDAVPHNWALLRPGTLAAVGDLANKLIAQPDAVTRQYVPATDDVLVYTDIVAPDGRVEIAFRAPDRPGRYPYLCTFPGHWMVMNGELVVE